MHLLYCKNCGDMITLKHSSNTSCDCGEVGGILEDNDKVNFFGNPYPVQIEDASFDSALVDQIRGTNKEIDLKAKMVPLSSHTYKRQ